MRYIPVHEYRFRDYNGFTPDDTRPAMAYLTCKNHPEMRFLTKNPFQRTLHFLGPYPECDCKFEDLLVVED